MPADILANVCILSTKYALEKKPDIKVFHVSHLYIMALCVVQPQTPDRVLESHEISLKILYFNPSNPQYNT